MLDRIDKVAGVRGRQRFIRDAILWRLDEEIPPIMLEIADEMNKLRSRVEHLEQVQSTSVYLGKMNDIAQTQICRDDLDRKLVAFFLQHEGATTPELASQLLGSSGKRRTILDRIAGINNRAEQIIGVSILQHNKGNVKGIRGAWWLINAEKVVD